jgi:sugar/nucleoside kinase (ribokinase family)
VPPLAVIGNLSFDRVGGETRAGGGPFHAARGLRLLPVPVRATILAKAADRSLLPPLAALGYPVRFRESTTTACFAFSYDGDRREMSIEELGEPWTPEDARGWVAEALGRTEWLHIAPLARSDFPAATLAALAQGRRILLDGQGLVRPARTGPLALDDGYDPEVLRHLTMLKLAEEEAQVIVPDVTEASLQRLGVPEVLVTLGSRGSLVYAGERLEPIPCHPVDADSTGAGDAFSAAYLAGRADGYAPAAAAERATRVVETMLQSRQ